MSQIDTINFQLRDIYWELVAYANSIDFEPICEFKLFNSDEIIPWEKLNSSGIYLVEIKNDLKHSNFQDWVTSFREVWEDPRYKGNFVSNLRKIRISRHSNLKEWIPLYIGKSKKIGGRVNEHLHKEMGTRTFAMKLKARDNINDEVFRLSIIKFPLENYDWVAPVFERTLRDRINPIIGRQ